MSKQLNDYDYVFPPELVAQAPLPKRDASRMMVLSRQEGKIEHSQFQNLPEFLGPKDLVVANDTSVLACRLFAQKPTGGKVEVFLLRPTNDLEWAAFLSPARGLSEGMRLQLYSREQHRPLGREVTVCSLKSEDFRVAFDSAALQREVLASYGEMPLPPYIERSAPRDEDRDRYQTLFAKSPGAVAAPTAGLHFTDSVLHSLKERGVQWTTLTLHVGAGTFLPVKTENIEEHPMHAEWYQIPQATIDAVQECKKRGGRVLAVGTTALRALESWAQTQQSAGWTKLFVRPGFQFQVVDLLLTNFHQPKSTLLMLVSALAGREFIFDSYAAALREGYRLFSYGDCMLIK
jgi:S-adenosylmethionine:tRNA ribosyltransferase-isomerase